MATGNLVNNTGTFDFYKQNNTITLFTNERRYVESDIVLNTKIHKAILNGTTDQTQFTVQIPNGQADPILLLFTTDSSGNTVVTGSNLTL